MVNTYQAGSTCVKHSDKVKVISLRKYLSNKAALLCSPQVQLLVFSASSEPFEKQRSVYNIFCWRILTILGVQCQLELFLCFVTQSLFDILQHVVITHYSFIQELHLYIFHSFILLSSTFLISKQGTTNIVGSWMPLFIYIF